MEQQTIEQWHGRDGLSAGFSRKILRIDPIDVDVEDTTCKKSNTEVDNNPQQQTNENEIVKKWNDIFSKGIINTKHEELEIKNAKHVFTDANTEEYFKGDIPFDKIVKFRVRWVSEFYRMHLPVPKTFHTQMFLFQRHPLPKRHEIMLYNRSEEHTS